MTLRYRSNGFAYRGDRSDQVAEWMAEHGGRVRDCARDLGLGYDVVKKAWQRIRHQCGSQAV